MVIMENGFLEALSKYYSNEVAVGLVDGDVRALQFWVESIFVMRVTHGNLSKIEGCF